MMKGAIAVSSVHQKQRLTSVDFDQTDNWSEKILQHACMPPLISNRNAGLKDQDLNTENAPNNDAT